MRFKPILTVLFCVAFSAGFVFSQSSGTGALSGLIKDPAGAVIPHARITVTNESTSQSRQIESNSDGSYMVQLLPAGTYKVEVAVTGFKTVVQRIRINVTETTALNFQLEVGAVSETVTVEGNQSIVQTETSSLGRVAEETVVKNLPLVTRNYTQILGLSPGVTTSVTNASELGRGSSSSGGGDTGAKSVNGSRQYDNTFEMNGIEATDAFGAGYRFGGTDISGGTPVPNPDAIEQFKVQTGQYDASYGRRAGGNVNVVTKGGSNQFHGSAFEFFRNDALNANDFFNNRQGNKKPIIRQNQFGFALGGPAIKDRVWFFGSYQGTRQLNGAASPCSANVSSPAITDDRSAAALGKLFAGKAGALGGVAILADGSNINPIALKIMQMKNPNGGYMIPTPQVVNTSLPFAIQGSSVFNPPCSFDEDQFMVNVDFLQSQKGKWEVRYFGANDDQANTIAAGNIPTLPKPIATDFKNASIAYTYVFGPRVTNDIRVGWNFTDAALAPTSPFKWSDLGVPVPEQSDDLPSVAITGSFNLAASTPTRITQNSYNFADSFSYLLGDHTLRFGGGITNRRLNNTGGRQTAALTFQSFPDFLLGMAGGTIASGGNGTASSNVLQSFNQTVLFDRRYRQISEFVYAQDDWKITPQLTLNLGLRFERMPNYTDAYGRLSNFDLNRANYNAPAGGTLEGFVVAEDYSGGALPSGVTKLDNAYGVAGNNQNTFSPRVGFAWRVLPNSSRFVLRAGYGLYNSQPPALSLFMTGLTQPWSSNQTNPGNLFPSITFQNPFRTPLPSPSMLPMFQPYSPTTSLSGNTYIAQSYRPSYTHQFSFNTQTELSRNYMLEVGYVGARALHLIRNRSVNQAGWASAANPIRGITTNTVLNVKQRAQILGFIPTGLTQIESGGSSWYNALQASLTKRYSSGFQFLASYTFSKSLDTDAANVVGVSENRANIGNQLDPLARYGRSSLDRTHRFIVNYLYELKFFRNTKGIANKLLDGWSVAGVTILQSGSPLTVTATNTNNAFGITNDRAQLAAGCAGSQVQAAGEISGRLNSYFNTACFTSYPIIGDDGKATAFGNSPVSLTNGPRQNNTDLVFAKRTKIYETVNMEFRTEFFNIFNHPQFANPATNFSASNFGQITALAVNPRFVQFALKLNF